jgi:pyruvate,water dikinase
MVTDLGDRLHRQGRTAWDYWGPEIERATERLDRFDFDSATDSQIADHLENARGVYHRHWTIHGSRLWITNRPHQSALMALLDHQNLDIDEIADELFEGEPTPSTRLIQGLYRLAQSALESPAIVSLIIDPPEDVLEVMGDHPEATGFLSLYGEFIREFGVYSGVGYGADRTISTPTWSEQPALVLGFVSRYLNPGVPDPATTRLAAQEKRDLQLKELVERCGDPISVAKLKREIDFGRRQAAIMEIHNHYIDQMMNGQLRHAIIGAAGRFVRRSILTKNEDIFWLHFDEITLALRSEKDIPFEEEISSRKKQHLEWEHLDPPPLLGIPGAYLPKAPPSRRVFKPGSAKTDSSLSGIGASPGQCRGRARIVSTSELLPDIQPGEILVAKTAGPRWTPILPTLGGLVLDGGSVGQHHSIIAREFGIPAVVGTGNGTSRISDGAWITVDGDTGAIEMEA